MTSLERHEARYQRRAKKRQERRLEVSKACGNFEDVFSYANLYRAGHICCRNVGWKSSTQAYRFNIITNTALTRRKLKKFKRWNAEGRVVIINGKAIRKKFTLADICCAYTGTRAHLKRGNSFYALQRLDALLKSLYGFHPTDKKKWRKALCT